MMKKTLLVGALSLVASGAALANGFYAGAGVGTLNLDAKTVDTTAAGTVTTSDTGNLGVNGVVMGGYEFAFANRMVLGLEAFGNYTSAKISNSTDVRSGLDTNSSLRLQSVYGVRVLPGYQVCESTSFHGILGVARGHFISSGSADVNASTESGSSHFSVNGYELGLGTTTDVYKNIAVRTDLIYTGYQSKTFEDNDGDTYKIEPSTVEFNVAAVYKFG